MKNLFMISFVCIILHPSFAGTNSLQFVLNSGDTLSHITHLQLDADSVALDAAYYLVGRGYASTTFTITTSDVHCPQCGELAVHSSPDEPRCDHCDAALPEVPGPAVVCRVVVPCA